MRAVLFTIALLGFMRLKERPQMNIAFWFAGFENCRCQCLDMSLAPEHYTLVWRFFPTYTFETPGLLIEGIPVEFFH